MKIYFLLGWLCAAVLGVQAQGSWELEKDADGIRVYTRAVAGSGFREFQVVSTVEGSLSSLVAVLKDAAAYKILFDRTSQARLLQTAGETTHVLYAYSDGPWPVADRDGIYEYRFRYEAAAHRVVIAVRCMPELLPEDSNAIRIQHCQGEWRLRSLPDGQVEVSYQFYADPGGSLPSWLVNWSTVDIPFNALSKLKEQVRLPQYQGQKFSFLPEG